MCGIAGILALDGPAPRAEELHAMIGALRHRGPDWSGVWQSDEAGLAMSRLSIIDLGGGSRMIGNEDGTIHIAFNGEIYNHRALQGELGARGHRLATATDTETIVHLYEELGPRCVERLRGMFAFALWDARKRRLVLARDRMGIKPLYWGRFGGRLVFGSEIKALLQLPELPRELDWEAVDHLFAAMHTPPERSILRGIHKLLPGHVLTASADGAVRIERYWRLRFAPDRKKDERTFAAELRERLDETVRLHLVSDVPVGAFLSGGVDSSAVVATMARIAGADPVRTFSIGFAERSHDESPWARLVARGLGVEHNERIVEPDVVGLLDDLAWFLDEPFGDTSAIPTWLVSRLAAEHVKVVLSGDGGDELFAGYDRYVVESKERERERLFPGAARRLLARLAAAAPPGMRGRNLLRHWSLRGAERYIDAVTLFHRDERRALFRRELHGLFPERDALQQEVDHLRSASGHWLSELQAFDCRNYLPLDILTKVDRMSMAASLEARVPLLDHEFVEFAATIPPELNLRNGGTKQLFKRAIVDRVPQAVLERPKQGFAVPLSAWFRGALDGWVRELLDSETTRARGIFEPAAVRALIAANAAGRPRDLQLWTLISFELWCRTFLDRTARVPQPATHVPERRHALAPAIAGEAGAC